MEALWGLRCVNVTGTHDTIARHPVLHDQVGELFIRRHLRQISARVSQLAPVSSVLPHKRGQLCRRRHPPGWCVQGVGLWCLPVHSDGCEGGEGHVHILWHVAPGATERHSSVRKGGRVVWPGWRVCQEYSASSRDTAVAYVSLKIVGELRSRHRRMDGTRIRICV